MSLKMFIWLSVRIHFNVYLSAMLRGLSLYVCLSGWLGCLFFVYLSGWLGCLLSVCLSDYHTYPRESEWQWRCKNTHTDELHEHELLASYELKKVVQKGKRIKHGLWPLHSSGIRKTEVTLDMQFITSVVAPPWRLWTEAQTVNKSRGPLSSTSRFSIYICLKYWHALMKACTTNPFIHA